MSAKARVTKTRPMPGAPLANITPETIYGGGAAGYTDYPTLS